MASFFGRSTKGSKEPAKSKNVKEEHKEEDLFSGMDITCPNQLSSETSLQHLGELKDLVLQSSVQNPAWAVHEETSESSAFSFLTQETEQTDNTDEKTDTDNVTERHIHIQKSQETSVANAEAEKTSLTSSKPEETQLTDVTPAETSLTASKPDIDKKLSTDLTSSTTAPSREKPMKKGKKKKIARRPGRDNVSQTKSPQSENKIEDDASSVASYTTSIASVDDTVSISPCEKEETPADTHVATDNEREDHANKTDIVEEDKGLYAERNKQLSMDIETNSTNVTDGIHDLTNVENLTETALLDENEVDNNAVEETVDEDQQANMTKCSTEKTVVNEIKTEGPDNIDKDIDESTESTPNIDTLLSENVDTVDILDREIQTESNIPDNMVGTPGTIAGSTELKSEDYKIQISDDEKIILSTEALRSRQERLREEMSLLNNLQKELINKWTAEHLTEEQVHAQVGELHEKQSVLEASEDFDGAADINQKIEELMKQSENYKYKHPVLDEKFDTLLKSHNELCHSQSTENEEILKEYETILSLQKTKATEDDKTKEKKFDEAALLLKEKKLKLERALSHASLDKEHLLKNETVLNEEINKKTKELNEEKKELVDKRSIVQVEIEELKQKLHLLEENEKLLNSNIDNIKTKLHCIVTEFQPKINKIMEEKEITEKEELQLKSKMDVLLAEEEAIDTEKMYIKNKKGRIQNMMQNIQEVIESIKESSNSTENEILSFADVFDINSVIKVADVDFTSQKEKLEKLEKELQETSNKIIQNESKQNSSQRFLNDLETQLSELQKVKQAAVKERKYKDAKRITEEVKSLTSEGEEKQKRVLQLEENIRIQKIKVEELTLSVEMTREKFKEKELSCDQQIISNLTNVRQAIENFLSRNPDCWMRSVLDLQLSNCDSIVNSLQEKHGILCSEVLEDQRRSQLEEVKKSIEELEAQLTIAESKEDWGKAEEINEMIGEKKEVLNKLDC